MADRAPGRLEWVAYVAAAIGVSIGVAAVVLAVMFPTMLCQRDAGSVVAGDNASGATQLEEALARVAQLEEWNRLLKAQLAQQQEQLEELQVIRDTMQQENQHLQKKLQGTSSEDSSGSWFWILFFLLVALVWKCFH